MLDDDHGGVLDASGPALVGWGRTGEDLDVERELDRAYSFGRDAPGAAYSHRFVEADTGWEASHEART